MSNFIARKYEKGSAESEEVRLSVKPAYLKITDKKDSVSVPIRDFDIQLAGHDQDRIKLTNLVNGAMIICHDHNLLEQIEKASKDPSTKLQAQNVKSSLKKRISHKIIYWSTFLVAALLICFGIYFAIDNIATLAVTQIPPKLEDKLGSLSVGDIKNYDTKSDTAKRINKIGQSLVLHLKDSPYKFHFYVLQSKTVNAYACPGGTIIVLSELIKRAKSDDEIADIIAHEIGHVIHRDGLRYFAHSAGLLVCIGLFINSSQAGNHLQDIIAATGLAQNLEQLRFSRSQESLADLTGVQLAFDAGYNPEALITFFDRLKKEDPLSNNQLFTVLANHPMLDERANAIRAEIARLKGSR
jgi:Zn-dependent protease with chaperone function